MSLTTITSRNTAIGPVLEITGDLGYNTAPQLRHAVANLTLTTGQLLVLDLAGLQFCDSSSLTGPDLHPPVPRQPGTPSLPGCNILITSIMQSAPGRTAVVARHAERQASGARERLRSSPAM